MESGSSGSSSMGSGGKSICIREKAVYAVPGSGLVM